MASGSRLIYGYYPEVVTSAGEEQDVLSLLTSSYLYKDLFAVEQLKKPVYLEKLLQVLALQIGGEVSYNELVRFVGADNQTIERYIDLLEKAFIVFRLQTLNRNMRQEIDYIEEYDGILHAYEFKWNPVQKVRFSKTFTNAYPGSETKVISQENYINFLT